MAVIINNGSTSITVKPHKIARQNRYAVKVTLNVPVSLGKDAIHIDMMFHVKKEDLAQDGSTKVIDFLNSLPTTVTISTDDDYTGGMIPDGTYYVESCEVDVDTNRRGLYSVRLSLFYQEP